MSIEQTSNGNGGDQNKKVLEDFLLSEKGQNIIKRSKSGINSEDDRRSAGILFEHIGFKWMESQMVNDEVLFSPENVFELLRLLYPDAKVEYHGGFNPSLIGISVPDGLIIKEGPKSLKISSIIEYKNVSKKSWRSYVQIREQARHYRPDVFAKELEDERISRIMGEAVHEMHNGLNSKPLIVDPNLKLIYVIPEDSSLRINNTIVKHAPVTRQQLFNMKEVLFKNALRK